MPRPDEPHPDQFEQLLRCGPYAVGVHDLEGRLLFANPALARLLGVTVEALLGRHVLAFVHPEARSAVAARLARLIGSDDVSPSAPTRLLRADGRTLDAEINGARLRYEGVEAVQIWVHDLSERRAIEAAAEAQARQLRQLTMANPLPTAILDTRFNVQMMNAKFTEVFGDDLAQIPDAAAWWRRALQDDAERHQAQQRWCARVKEVTDGARASTRPMRLWMRTRGGARRFMEMTASRIDDGYIVVFQDLTKEAEARSRLEESERRLNLILEGAQLGTWDWDVPTGAVRFNARWAEMLGERLEDIEPHISAWEARIHDEDRASTLQATEAHFREEVPIYSIEFRMRHKTRGWVWIQSIGRVMERTATGYAKRVVGVHVDINERKRAQQRVEEQGAFYRDLYEHIHDGVIMQDVNGHVLSCNQAAASILGISTEALLMRGPTDMAWRLVDEEGRPLEADAHPGRRVLLTAQPARNVILGVHTPQGALRWIEINANPLRSPATGQPLGVVSSFTEITAQREALLALRESQQRLADAIDAAHLGTWEWDLRTDEVQRDARWVAIVGAQAAPGPSPVARWLERVHPDDLPKLRATLQAHFEGDAPFYEMEHRLRAADDRWIWVLDRGRVVAHDASGAPLRMAGAFLDLTQQKAAEADRLRVEKRMGELEKLESLAVLAGGIAHDFNNLLVGVQGNAELALYEVEEGAAPTDLLAEILNAAKHATDLAKQMLAYSGRGQLKVGLCDLSAYIRDLLSVLRASISPNVRLSSDLIEPLPLVEADDIQIRQVMMNLVINAAESIGEGEGEVWISTGHGEYGLDDLRQGYLHEGVEAGHYAFFEVRDTGCGFDEETARRLFEPFFTTKFTGRGLGLSAVLGVVRAHRGALTVYSEPGNGSTFRVLLPISTRDDLPRPTRGTSPRLARFEGRLALVVDDEAPVRAVTARMLRRLGLSVEAAADGVDALSLAARLSPSPDVVLLDMTMPRMNGAQTLAALRAQGCGAVVVLMSGYNEQDILPLLWGATRVAFLQKPFSLERLSEVLHGLFGDDAEVDDP
ncbi:PAS domain S-box protein [Myxococcota bacterium]|nr:PAS domain S-box protein [Myxococcota bacterium]